MNRTGARYWKGLMTLVVLAVGASTLAPPATAQTNGTEPDQQEVLVHYSLYYENYKNENYRDALPDLHWILDHAPGFPKDKDTNFDRAVKTYEALSVLVMFDRAVPTIQGLDGEIDEFEWTRNKGRFIQTNVDHLDERKGEAIDAYLKAYELDPQRLDPFYLDIIIRNYYTEGDIGAALDFIRELKDTRGEEQEIKDLIKKYFSVIPPEEQMTFLEEQLAEDPENPEIVKQLFDLYEQEGYNDKMMELAPRLQQMDPTPQVLRLLMRLYIENGEYAEAEGLFEQLEDMPESQLKAEDYLNMGIAQQNLGNFNSARTYYRQALEVNSNFNQANEAIASLYATVVPQCGVNDRKDKGVYWLIADAYQRAGNSAAASRYRSVFPTEEDVFFFDEWTKGASVQVSYTCRGLTISGTTTVRTSN